MKQLFLSGGSGFIGRNILEQLGCEYAIDAPSHKDLPLEDEAEVSAFFKNRHYDAIIHTAVKPYHRMAEDTRDVFDINLAMYQNLKAQVKKNRADKMLVTGTGSEYSMDAYQPNMSEDYFGQHVPKDTGTLSRYQMAEDIEKTDLSVFNLRIFGVFGKYEKHDMRFISSNILRQLFGLPMTMKQDRRFSYLYIDDLMTVLKMFIEQTLRLKTYNIVPDEKILLSEILEMLRQAAGVPNYPVEILSQGMASEYTGDNSRLMTEFSELRFTPMQTAVQKLYDYYQQNIEKFSKAELLADSMTKSG